MEEQGIYRPADEDEINLLDYWRVIWKHKWLIGALCSVSVIAALVFSLLSPKIYESTATILTPREGGGGNLLSALGATGLAQQVAGISFPSLPLATMISTVSLCIIIISATCPTVPHQQSQASLYWTGHIMDPISWYPVSLWLSSKSSWLE